MTPRPPRDKRIAFMSKILPELKAAIDRLGDENNRSASNTAETIMLEWFRDHRPELLNQPVPFEEIFRSDLGKKP
jgi:hypothetical protein